MSLINLRIDEGCRPDTSKFIGRLRGGILITSICAIAVIADALPAAAHRFVLRGNYSAQTAARLSSAPQVASARILRMAATMPLRNGAELRELMRAQQDPASPLYHRWLPPGEFTARFGPTQADLSSLARWLASNGFRVESASAARRSVAFRGRSDAAEHAFGVKIAAGPAGVSYANLSDPSVPGALAPLISHIGGLSNAFHAAPALEIRADGPVQPASRENLQVAFGPPDLYTFYDQTPLFQAGIDGSGTDCIAVVADTNFDDASVGYFSDAFGLPPPNLVRVFADGQDPGIAKSDLEVLIDVEYAHAAAPGAPIRVYIGDDNSPTVSPNGGLFDAIQTAVDDDRCGSIDISYGYCGLTSADYTNLFEPLFAQAATQGQTVTVASGDWGAAQLTLDSTMTACVPSRTRGVSEIAASPDVTAIGGTQFKPRFNRDYEDVGTRREKAWRDRGRHAKTGGATGGGISAVFSQPAYQKSVEPKQTMRTIPDVAFGASLYHPGFFFGYDGNVQCCVGGTSLGTPYWAGIAQLVQQESGARPGPLNPALYSLGPDRHTSGLRDVRRGNNRFNHVRGYRARRGYDLATGWGTPDIATLVPALAGQ